MESDAGEPDDEASESDRPAFRTPLPPEDRLWRHPSELGGASTSEGVGGRPARGSWLLIGTTATAASMLTVGLLAMIGAFDDNRPIPPPVVVREAVAPVGPVVESNIPDLVQTVQPAVVRLEVTGEENGVGSGVLFRSDGHLLTNAHVVDESSAITVLVADGRRLSGKVVGVDRETDIAVVKVDHEIPFPTATLGSVDDLHVGQLVIAIGSPLGLAGPASVTTGIVSAMGRDVRGEDDQPLRDLIQTDATIAPGSSGGALFDGRGVMVGVTTAFAVGKDGAEGVGFAIPADVAKSVANSLIEGHAPDPGWLGVHGDDAPGGGAMLVDVPDGTPADRAGLVDGDVVLELGGRKITTMSVLRICLRDHRPGEQVQVVYRRGGERRVAMATLGRRKGND